MSDTPKFVADKMPVKLSKKIAECHRFATEARQRASAAIDPSVRHALLDVERRWIILADRYAAMISGVEPRNGATELSSVNKTVMQAGHVR